MKKTIIKTMTLGMAAICTVSALTCLGIGAAEKSDQFISGTDTVYSVGSVSKMYVTVAAMQLADKGLIDIDEPVTTYIPEFKMADSRYKDITVRMLMDHTSGILGTTDNAKMLFDDFNDDWEDDFLEALSRQRLKAAPGEYSTYCNDGFDLLQIVVERVSGMDFTDYVTRYIAAPIGASQTGSYKNSFRSPYQVDIYDVSGNLFAVDYDSGIGAGGILSTAAEVCRFGAAFFSGDNTLLSENSKKLMEQDESSSKYEGHYALGWDDVDVYEGTGVKVVTKGGDLVNQHSALLVAPDEKISIAVCTSGGDSGLDTLVASSLMDIVLADRGITHETSYKTNYTLVDTIPDEYKKYEGLYATSNSILNVTFPEMCYVQVDKYDDESMETSYYKYTAEGVFVNVLGDVPNGSRIFDPNGDTVGFEKRPNGKIYITTDEIYDYTMIGSYKMPAYYAEKLDDEPADPEAVKKWSERCGRYYVVNSKYSSFNYFDYTAGELVMSEAADGYVHALGLKKIVDADHLRAFVNIPGNMGRDQIDIEAVTKDGKEYLSGNNGLYTMIREDYIPQLDKDKTEISFSARETHWYKIGDDLSGKKIALDRTEKTSVYIIDASDAIIYSTYMTGFGKSITLPKKGKIAFIGEPGEHINVSFTD